MQISSSALICRNARTTTFDPQLRILMQLTSACSVSMSICIAALGRQL